MKQEFNFIPQFRTLYAGRSKSLHIHFDPVLPFELYYFAEQFDFDTLLRT